MTEAELDHALEKIANCQSRAALYFATQDALKLIEGYDTLTLEERDQRINRFLEQSGSEATDDPDMACVTALIQAVVDRTIELQRLGKWAKGD